MADLDPINEAKARAARNGLTLELGDVDIGVSWPGMRMATAWLFEGSKHVAGFAITYSKPERRDGALRFCAERVFNRPDRAD